MSLNHPDVLHLVCQRLNSSSISVSIESTVFRALSLKVLLLLTAKSNNNGAPMVSTVLHAVVCLRLRLACCLRVDRLLDALVIFEFANFS